MNSMIFLAAPFIALVVLMLGFASKNSMEASSIVPEALLIAGLVILLAWMGVLHERVGRFFRLKGTKHRFISLGSTVLVGMLCIGLGMLANRPRFNLTWDATRDHTNTLSDQTVKVIDNLKKKGGEPVKILAFLSSEEEKDKFGKLMGLYSGKLLPADIEYVDMASEPTRALAQKVTVANTVIFKLAQNESRITTFTEEKITNALMKLSKHDVKKIYFTKGHGEGDTTSQDADGLHIVTQDLENNSYSVEELSLIEKGGVPQDAGLVVVAGPRYDFSKAETDLLDQFLRGGGAMLMMVNAMRPVTNLADLAKKYGIQMNDDLVLLGQDDPRVQLIGQNNAIVSNFDEFNPMTKDFAGRSGVALVMSNTRSLGAETENAMHTKVSLVANTLDSMVGIAGVKTEKDLELAQADHIKRGPFAVVALATGIVGGSEFAKTAKAGPAATKGDVTALNEPAPAKKVQLVVTGSADFATNAGVQRHENFDMYMNMVNFLLQDEDSIAIRPKAATASSLDMTPPSSHFNLLLVSFVYPFAFLGLGVFLWLKRRSA